MIQSHGLIQLPFQFHLLQAPLYILTGLDAGVEYIIRVRASCEIGAGAWKDGEN